MAGLMQFPTCRSPAYCHGFFSSRRLPTGKKFEHLDLGAKYLRSYAKLEAGRRASGATVDSVRSDVEEKTSTSFKLSGRFENPKWKNGTWDIRQFAKDGKVDWDAVIDAAPNELAVVPAMSQKCVRIFLTVWSFQLLQPRKASEEVRRRKCLEDNPEASTNREPVIFDTSIVPWWAWVKRFHLPQAELLNGRAAMVGFFMAYVVDSLTGVGLVDQINSFFGKLFLLIAVTCVLFIRNNQDITNLKQIVKEFNLYDKQWQATWQDDKPED